MAFVAIICDKIKQIILEKQHTKFRGPEKLVLTTELHINTPKHSQQKQNNLQQSKALLNM